MNIMMRKDDAIPAPYLELVVTFSLIIKARSSFLVWVIVPRWECVSRGQVSTTSNGLIINCKGFGSCSGLLQALPRNVLAN
jgi:hypothetical protein